MKIYLDDTEEDSVAISTLTAINNEYPVLGAMNSADYFQGEWGGDLPKPKHILREAVRLVKQDGLILILHIIIIPAYSEYCVKREALHPI